MHLAPLPALRVGQSAIIKATADFEDEKGVDVSAGASYLTVSSADISSMGLVGQSGIQVDDSRDLVRATGTGPALIVVTRIDTDGRTVRAVSAVNTSDQGNDNPIAIEPDVYPGTLAVVPGGTRQLKVHVLDPNSGGRADVHEAKQITFAGTPESVEEYLDPATQVPLLDPDTGEFMFDPESGELLLDPNSGSIVRVVTPAVPPVTSGTRYIVSDESIATVSENGLITAISAGQVTISIVHLASMVDQFGNVSEQVIGQSTLVLTVQAAQVVDEHGNGGTPQAVTVARDTGGIVSDTTGETVMIGAGALSKDTPVSISRLDLADIDTVAGIPLPGPGVLEALGAFRLNVGATATQHPLQLAIPSQGISVQPGDEVLFFRKGTVLTPDGLYRDTWWLVDNGYVGADGVARTASPPYGGLDSSGDYVVCKRIPGAIGSSSFGLLTIGAGDWLSVGAMNFCISGGITGMTLQSDIVDNLMTNAGTLGAGSYRFGVPQFVDIPMPAIPPGERYDLDLRKLMPPVSSPWGNIAIPNLATAVIDEAANVLRLTPAAAASDPFKGQIIVRALLDDGSSRDITSIAAGSSAPIEMALSDLKTADGKAFAVASARWQLVRAISTDLITSSGNLSGGDPLEFAGNTLRLAPRTDMAAVLTRTGVTFIRQNKPVGQTALVGLLDDNNNFDGTTLTGTKVQPVVFTDDLSRAYVAGNGVVYVIDMVTFKQIDALKIPAGKNIASLATFGNWLFIGEGQNFGTGASGNRLLVMDINPGNKQYHQAVSLKNTGIEATALGIAGMTVSPDGKTLVVATPINRNNVSLGDPTKRGDILIFDLKTLNHKTGSIAPPVKAQLPSDGISGKSPQIITTTNDPNRYLVANVADTNRGLSTLVVSRDVDGKITGAKMAAIDMSQPDNAIRIDRLNIQRAQSAVLVKQNGIEYAIVADDNYHFLDPYWKAMYEAPNFLTTPFGPPIAYGGSASAKKVAVGGKLGIIKDPFGLNGQPQFLGATLPLDGYGIINLSLSEDGKVLIGQLKGGYSANIFDMSQRPHQSRAWNVDTLIQAALAMPDQDRMSKHVTLPQEAAQLIADNASPPAGTSFDDEIALPKLEGRPGDINAIHLKKMIAQSLGIAETEIRNVSIVDDLQSLFGDSERNVDVGRKDGYVAGTKEGKLQLLTRKDGDQRKLLSRTSVDGAGDDTAAFSDTGILFAYRHITADEVRDRLRAGKMLSEQSRAFNFLFERKVNGEWKVGNKAQLTITITDAPTGATVFFGDRPLDNPGYSAMKLQGEVAVGSTDKLDVYKVEQRLKYLGFPALDGTGADKDFVVDGEFKADESKGLERFEKVVRYQSATATGTGTGTSGAVTVSVEVQYRATVNATSANVKLEEVPGSLRFELTSNPANMTRAALTAAIASAKNAAVTDAKARALNAAGFTSATDKNGMDGKIESDVKNAQRKTTLNWLNAYNAPHWMQFFATAGNGYATTNAKLGAAEWVNLQTGGADKNNVFGTSWLFDLMQAATTAMTDETGAEALRFNGAGDLGMALNLGISPQYIAQGNQNRIDGKDVVLGLTQPAANSTVPAGITGAGIAAYTQKQWSYNNAVTLSGLLAGVNKNSAFRPDSNNTGLNNQRDALRDLLTFFTATHKEEGDADVQGNGSWEELDITGTGDKETIRRALFGDGTESGGLIDQQSVLLGGTATAAGSAMTGKTLAELMSVSEAVAQRWVEPLQKAMAEFAINTPQRIAAFLAQIKLESGATLGGLEGKPTDLREGYSYPNTRGSNAAGDRTTAQKIAGLFPSSFPTLASATTFVANNLPAFVATYDAGGRLMNSPRGFTEAEGEILFNQVYANRLGNGNVASSDGWRFRGHGLKQLTGRANFQAFANYVNANPIAGQPTGAQIMATPDLLASNFELAARSAAWYWGTHNALRPYQAALPNYPSAGRLNTKADTLNWTSLVPAADRNNFDQISRGVGLAVESYARRWNNYVDNVANIAGDGNPYDSMHEVLARLGVQAANADGFQKQIGVSLKARTPQQIVEASNLLAETADAEVAKGSGMLTNPSQEQTRALIQFQLSPALQSLVEQARSELNLDEGEELMWISDVPALPPSISPMVMVAEASRGNKKILQAEKILGVCITMKVAESISPLADAQSYMYQFHRQDLFSDGATAKIIQPPKNGVLELSPYNSHPNHYQYLYTSNPPKSYGDSEGRGDFFVMAVENKGITVTIRYYINIQSEDEAFFELCDKQSWKISTASPQPLDIATVLRNASLSALLADASQTQFRFADLPGSALGQVTGTSITLDHTAAGHGWFVDATPTANEEFLPTADPNIWQARPGSAAAGKMDMLSVLLHEYGHVLGIEHSHSQHDAMSATLQPGMRRTLSADELTHFTEALVAFQSGNTDPHDHDDHHHSPETPFPQNQRRPATRLARSSNRFGASEPPKDDAPDHLTAVNPTLMNGAFASQDHWTTNGNVSLASGAATLGESTNAQVALRQSFVLNTHDRFLRFTVTGALTDSTGPDDTFEAALLDANTNATLVSGLGLSRSDAFLNLQADGTERKSDKLRRIDNPDGSRTYVLDIQSIAAGTAVTLSFDLIGFGAANSAVVIRDVQLGGLPQLADDVVATNEDTPLVIDALANDTDADADGFVPVIVTAAAHGTVTLNADGSFSYTPDANFFGTDSFTYRISDGSTESNLATVRINVAAVNDKPLASDAQATLAEDTPLVFNLLPNVSDVDGDALVITLGQPQHGTIFTRPDGSVVYTPNANYHGTDSVTFTVSDGQETTTAVMRFVIVPVNDAPLVQDDAAAASEDTTVTVEGNVLVNDSDVDPGTVLRVAEAGSFQGRYGTLTLAQDGSYRYQLANDSPVVQALRAGETLVDVFTYAATDGIVSTPSRLTVSITGANDGPVAQQDTAAAIEDGGAVTLDAATLLANDTDADAGDSKTIVAVTTSTAGAQVKLVNGNVVYDIGGLFQHLGKGQTATDVFTYTMMDKTGATSTTQVTMTITGTNDVPVWTSTPPERFEIPDPRQWNAQVAQVPGQPGTLVTIDFSWLERNAAFQNEIGLYLVDDASGRIGNLRPGEQGYAQAALSTTRAQVIFKQGQTAGAANSIKLAAGQHVGFYLIANGTTAEWRTRHPLGAPLTKAAHAWFSIPTANHDGTDHLRGTWDSRGQITLRWEDLPQGGDKDYDDAIIGIRGLRPQATSFIYDARATDADGDSLTYRLLQGPAGAWIDPASGRLCWNAPVTGTHTFRLQVSDGKGGIAEQVFAVSIGMANTAPVAQNASVTLDVNDKVRIDLDKLASDADGDRLTITTSQPARGTLTKEKDGTWLYRPAKYYVGTDSFSYTVSDGKTATTARIDIVVRRKEDDRGCRSSAKIVVRSTAGTPSGKELEQIFLSEGNADEDKQSARPVIDWGSDKNTPGVIPIRSGKGWLSELLGMEEEDAADLLQATGLKVKLVGKGARH